MKSRVATLIADGAVFLATIAEIEKIAGNSPEVLAVLSDAIVEGFFRANPDKADACILDGDILSEIEANTDDSITTVRDIKEITEQAYQKATARMGKKAALYKNDEATEKALLLLLPKNNSLAHSILARRIIEQQGSQTERNIVKIQDDVIATNQALQSTVFIAVREIGINLGMVLAQINDNKLDNTTSSRIYDAYNIFSYLNNQACKQISRAFSMPGALISVASAGFLEGLAGIDPATYQEMDSEAQSLSVKDIRMAFESLQSDFGEAYRSSMKYQSKYDSDDVEEVLQKNPAKAKKINQIRGRKLLQELKIKDKEVGSNIVWGADVLTSLGSAVGAAGSKLVHSGCKLAGQGAAWLLGLNNPDETAITHDKADDKKHRE